MLKPLTLNPPSTVSLGLSTDKEAPGRSVPIRFVAGLKALGFRV